MKYTEFKKLSYQEKNYYLEGIKVFKKYKSDGSVFRSHAINKALNSTNAKDFYYYCGVIKRNGEF